MLQRLMYVEHPAPVKLSRSAVEITGRNIAHAHRTKDEGALAAIDLVNGELAFVKPTMVQAANLFRVSLSYVYLASRIAHDPDKRRAVLEGRAPLYKVADGESLATRFRQASPRERLAVAHELGADTIWDTMICPILDK